MVSMATVNKALKDIFVEPIRNNIKFMSDPLVGRVMQSTNHIVGAASIVRDAVVGVNGGIAAGTETGALPAAAENMYEQLSGTTKNLFGSIEITDKAMRGVRGSNAGSFINALNSEMMGLLKTSRWNYGRQFYGDGNGVLMVCKANASSSKVIEAASTSSVQFMLPGLKLDLHKASDNTVYSGMDGVRVTDVDYTTGKIQLDTATAIVSGDYLTIQNSYGLEMTGLGKIFETLSGAETLYGLNRADYAWLRPYVVSSFGAISESKIQDAINLVTDHWSSNINHLAFGNTAYNYYQQLLTSRRALNDTMKLEGGWTALIFNGQPLVRNPYMVATDAFLLDTSMFSVDMISDWNWIEGTDGVLNLIPGYPLYRGSITKYCDIMCTLPGGLIKLGGVAAPA